MELDIEIDYDVIEIFLDDAMDIDQSTAMSSSRCITSSSSSSSVSSSSKAGYSSKPYACFKCCKRFRTEGGMREHITMKCLQPQTVSLTAQLTQAGYGLKASNPSHGGPPAKKARHDISTSTNTSFSSTGRLDAIKRPMTFECTIRNGQPTEMRRLVNGTTVVVSSSNFTNCTANKPLEYEPGEKPPKQTNITVLSKTQRRKARTRERKHGISRSSNVSSTSSIANPSMDVVQSSLTSNTCDRQPEVPFLRNMRHIVLVDIDNWKGIFKSDLPFSQRTFVWGFWGGNTSWDPPKGSALFQELENHNCFYLHPKCSGSKDAADFALCVQAGKLDIMLPKSIPFTVLSGDCGFQELQN